MTTTTRPAASALATALLILPLTAALTACQMPDATDGAPADQSEFAQAVPRANLVAMNVPGAEAVRTDAPDDYAGPTLAESGDAITLGGIKTLVHDVGTWAVEQKRATFYQATWDVSRGVNRFVFALIASIKEVDTWPPTSQTATSRTWGPWTEALSPVFFKLTITKAAPGTMMFALAAKPKHGGDGEFTNILWGDFVGVGEGRGHGEFHIDATAARALDPEGNGGVGRLDIRWSNYTQPRSVDMELVDFADRLGDETSSATYHYREAADGSGVFEFAVNGDLDKGKDPARSLKERLGIVSRWLATGEGRADVVVTGGDLPWPNVHAQECWDAQFHRTFYTDDRGASPTEGEPSACALPAL